VTEMEHALASTRDALNSSQQTLAAVAHELRQAIGAVISARSVLRAAPGAEAMQRAEAVVDRQLDVIRGLVDDLNDLSRLPFDRTRLDVHRVTIQEILEAAIDSVKPTIDRSHHELFVKMPDHAIPIEADAIRLQQVFSNLLTNAATYTAA